MEDFRENFFLIGIGGTGMRCLEAFIHLCAMGMMDGKEIHILGLDTDRDNGNFERLEKLVNNYHTLKGYNKPQSAHKNTFFSAKINFYKFSPDYSTKENGSFSNILELVNAPEQQQDLANLLFSRNVQVFDLKHGYRAQTHLGSLLMYHSIIDEVVSRPDSEIWRYIDAIYQSSENAEATKVFVTGSVFGGTGASSIPVIPKSFNKVLDLRSNKTLSKVYFGATLLTNYFTFREPDEKEVKDKQVIARASSFALNSQAAMMFYEEDLTVKQTYQQFYMIGTDDPSFKTEQTKNETITGGKSQRNDSHFIELFAAFAAYDFFNTHHNILEDISKEKKAKYYYRMVDQSTKLDFKDFVGSENVDRFKMLFTCFTAMSFLVNIDRWDFFEHARSGALEKDNIEGYDRMHIEEVRAIKQYFNLYHFYLDTQGKVQDGWLRQVHRSANQGENFLFDPQIFGYTSKSEIENAKFHQLFSNKEYVKHNFDVGLNFGFTKTAGSAAQAFDHFKEVFKKDTKDAKMASVSEMLIKRMYDTLRILYSFN